ncbi:hypothetical protein EYZ11_010516 [Aspergillus tanneri]|nr:hypothetical protein EYZ11_010516 [Aspergillus tanneri]
MTSGATISRSQTAKRWDGPDESNNKMTLRSFGRKLVPSRKGG